MMNTQISRPTRRSSAPIERADIEEAKLVPSLLSISKSTRAFLALLLAEIDLHPGQDQLLQRLSTDEAISVSMLADQLAVRPSTVSKMLDRLIEKRLVARSANSRDARRTMVTLTEEGRGAQAAVLLVWERLESELTVAIPKDEIGRMMTSLRLIDELLSAKLRRLR